MSEEAQDSSQPKKDAENNDNPAPQARDERQTRIQIQGNKNEATSSAIELDLDRSQLSYILQGAGDKCRLSEHTARPVNTDVDRGVRKKLIIASILCLFFMICEIVGGVLANSLAIATDAAHLLTDFAAFMISLLAIWIAGRKATQRMSFGWHRAEVLGALISVLLIWFITAILVWIAIERISSGVHEVDGKIMLITAAIAIVVNIILAFQLQHGHSHGGSQHSHTQPLDAVISSLKKFKVASKKPSKNEAIEFQDATSRRSDQASIKMKDNINIRAAFVHVVGDLFQSIGVLVAAIIIYFRPDWAIADPICTFLFSVIVLYSTFFIFRDILLVLMEGTPKYMEYNEVLRTFKQIEGVVSVHNLRMWALSINKVALSAHLTISPGVSPRRVLHAAQHAVHSYYNFYETTIQIEEGNEAVRCSVTANTN